MTRKVVYNDCYGGFSLSLEGCKMYIELLGKTPKFYSGKSIWDEPWYIEKPHDCYSRNIPRHDAALVLVVETLGYKANGDCADLRIREVVGPYRIDEYDGKETVETPDRDDYIY